jgi:hypothetical protein
MVVEVDSIVRSCLSVARGRSALYVNHGDCGIPNHVNMTSQHPLPLARRAFAIFIQHARLGNQGAVPGCHALGPTQAGARAIHRGHTQTHDGRDRLAGMKPRARGPSGSKGHTQRALSQTHDGRDRLAGMKPSHDRADREGHSYGAKQSRLRHFLRTVQRAQI